ncbi:MAG: hypothetical protein KatS3mg017_0059 [Fimbriimonadales bacterium]|nr:MAG: hypothetical protein KatS3mg017_0059 [Fimbriimonadales bacterium]
MRKEGYCAFGARRAVDAVEAWQAQLENLDASDFSALEEALEAAHRLQTCLTLFRACYPKTRVALWKRRLRRLIRALHILRDDRRLIRQLETLEPSPEHQAGVQRALLRLRQRTETHTQTLQQAWRLWQASRAPNEIRGLAKRWLESFSNEPPDMAYAQRQWMLFQREQASALETDTKQSLEVRCGRLRSMLEGATILQPLGIEQIDLQTAHSRLCELEAQRFRQYAQGVLEAIAENEREQMARYAGNLRGYARIRKGIEWASQQVGDLF